MNQEDLNLEQSEASESHRSSAAKLGAVGGAVAGTALGKSVAGRFGAVVGAVTGAIAGGKAAGAMSHSAKEANESSGLDLGADRKKVDLPPHYSWEELQALSRPQE